MEAHPEGPSGGPTRVRSHRRARARPTARAAGTACASRIPFGECERWVVDDPVPRAEFVRGVVSWEGLFTRPVGQFDPSKRNESEAHDSQRWSRAFRPTSSRCILAAGLEGPAWIASWDFRDSSSSGRADSCLRLVRASRTSSRTRTSSLKRMSRKRDWESKQKRWKPTRSFESLRALASLAYIGASVLVQEGGRSKESKRVHSKAEVKDAERASQRRSLGGG